MNGRLIYFSLHSFIYPIVIPTVYVTTPYATSISDTSAVALDGQGAIYVASWTFGILYKILQSGNAVPFVGNSQMGFADGVGTQALFYSFSSIVFSPNGNFYIADRSNQRVRQVTTSGVVTTFAGQASSGWQDGIGNISSNPKYFLFET